MPNTLAHLGIGALVTRSLVRDADIKWIYLGCIIPDIPWISLRFLEVFYPSLYNYDMVLYSTVQASLLFCIFISFVVSSFSNHYWRILTILVLGSILHLILDAFQIKWGNGVHFFIPFNWSITHFDLFQIESYPTYLITFISFIYVLYTFKKASLSTIDTIWPSKSRLSVSVFFLLIYIIWPFYLIDDAEGVNTRSIKVLRGAEGRIGKEVLFDRMSYVYRPEDKGQLIHWKGKSYLEGIDLKESATLSVRGSYISEDTIQVKDYKVHINGLRSSASLLGLLSVFIVWIRLPVRQLILFTRGHFSNNIQ